MLKLSVLDQSPIKSGATATDALAETVALAEAVDRAGYHRYWVAEHHATGTFAGPAPEIMIARIGAATSGIRVGAGGVMLSHYSPLKVAETFGVLGTLYPGRVDLGIGRAPGSDHITALALGYGSQIGIEYFPTRIADLIAFMTGTPPPTEAFARIDMAPKPPVLPEIWLLGSSDQSALLAAHFGVSFSFAQFIAAAPGPAVCRAYRERFRPSAILDHPETSVCAFVICAETADEAEDLAASRDLVSVMRERGMRGPYPSVEEARAYPYTEADRAIIARSRERLFIGDPATCRDALTKLAEDHGAGEVVVLTICHDPDARRRSYTLLGEAFGLAKRGVAPSPAERDIKIDVSN